MPSITWGNKTEQDEFSNPRLPDFPHCTAGHQRGTFFAMRFPAVQ